MPVDGVLAQDEVGGDLSVAQTPGDKCVYIPLSTSERTASRQRSGGDRPRAAVPARPEDWALITAVLMAPMAVAPVSHGGPERSAEAASADEIAASPREIAGLWVERHDEDRVDG